MNISRCWITACLLCSTVSLIAQNEVDALRYSLQDIPGTARSLGMGGAYGAVGADISAFSGNPAGLGLYRRGTLEAGVNFGVNSSNALYEGTEASNSRSNFRLQSIGWVRSRARNDQKQFFNWGIANMKVNNFNQSVVVDGVTNRSSILNLFRDRANGTPFDSLLSFYPFDAGLAWYTYGIDTVPGYYNYYRVPYSGGDIRQRKTMNRSGAMSETSFGGGMNFNNQVYVGLSIGILTGSYSERSNYFETFTGQDISSLTFNENLAVSLSGVNIKLGVLYNVTPSLRLGGAYLSGTRISCQENYSSSMNTNFTNGDAFNQSSPDNSNSYIIRTPQRYMANAAYMLGSDAMITADYVLTPYQNITMASSRSIDYNYAKENEAIKALYRSASQARVGFEYRLAEVYRVRAGFVYQQSPFIAGVGNSPNLTYSLGCGYRSDSFFADLGVLYNQSSAQYYLFNPAYVDAARISSANVRVLCSIGFRL